MHTHLAIDVIRANPHTHADATCGFQERSQFGFGHSRADTRQVTALGNARRFGVVPRHLCGEEAKGAFGLRRRRSRRLWTRPDGGDRKERSYLRDRRTNTNHPAAKRKTQLASNTRDANPFGKNESKYEARGCERGYSRKHREKRKGFQMGESS